MHVGMFVSLDGNDYWFLAFPDGGHEMGGTTVWCGLWWTWWYVGALCSEELRLVGNHSLFFLQWVKPRMWPSDLLVWGSTSYNNKPFQIISKKEMNQLASIEFILLLFFFNLKTFSSKTMSWGKVTFLHCKRFKLALANLKPVEQGSIVLIYYFTAVNFSLVQCTILVFMDYTHKTIWRLHKIMIIGLGLHFIKCCALLTVPFLKGFAGRSFSNTFWQRDWKEAASVSGSRPDFVLPVCWWTIDQEVVFQPDVVGHLAHLIFLLTILHRCFSFSMRLFPHILKWAGIVGRAPPCREWMLWVTEPCISSLLQPWQLLE